MDSNSTPPRYPSAFALGFTSPYKTQVRGPLKVRWRGMLGAAYPLPDSVYIYAKNYGGHSYTDPRQNIGLTSPELVAQWFQYCTPQGHPGCNSRYHPLTGVPDLTNLLPEKDLYLAALKEVCAVTPRLRRPAHTPSSATPTRRRHQAGQDDWQFVNLQSPLAGQSSSSESVAASNITTSPTVVSEDTTSLTVLGDDPFAHYSRHGSILPLSFGQDRDNEVGPEEPVPEESVVQGASASVNDADVEVEAVEQESGARAESVLSISSDSSSGSEPLILGYPDATIFDLDTPVRLTVMLDVNVTHRLTVYPRVCEEAGEWKLYLTDYHDTLLSAGFNTSMMGDIYMSFTGRWLSYPWRLAIPISSPNSLIFVRPFRRTVGHPSDALDVLF
ncbi:hypothetical protein DFH06DRAFT_1351207 [Mycena polygramma]|nr:hypothetical protein DFH06DRAFT_1351207 [Mycena polygramma]